MKYLLRSRSIHLDEKTKSFDISEDVFNMLWDQKPTFPEAYEKYTPRKDKWTQVSFSNSRTLMWGYFLEIKRVK